MHHTKVNVYKSNYYNKGNIKVTWASIQESAPLRKHKSDLSVTMQIQQSANQKKTWILIDPNRTRKRKEIEMNATKLLWQTEFVTNNRLPNSTIKAEAVEKNKTQTLYKPKIF